MKKETFTARPKRTSDGAVSARYKKAKQAEPEKKTGRAAVKAVQKTEKSTAAKKTLKTTGRKTEKTTDKKAPVRRAAFKAAQPVE